MDNKTKLLKGIFEHLHEAYMLMKLYQEAQNTEATYGGPLDAVDSGMILYALSKIDNELKKQGVDTSE